MSETQFALVLVATSTDWKARADNDVTILEISTDEQTRPLNSRED